MKNDRYIIRHAELEDIEFLADTIIEAEKSGTDNCGIAKFFEISESEMKKYLISMLSEEIDGCELSVSSFIVATYEDKPVAALAGWLEGENEDKMQSSLLKSNLISYVMPKNLVLKSNGKFDIVKDIQIPREMGTYQFEYAHVNPNHLGHKLMQKLMLAHFERALRIDPNVKKVCSHPFDHNETIILIHEQMGFVKSKVYHSDNPLTKEYYPSQTMILMEKYF